MNHPDLNRRDFHRLSMAALGGALAGTVTGCNTSAPPAPAPPPAKPGASAATGASDSSSAAGVDSDLANSVAAVGVEKHVCRGLNACKGQGGNGANECAGQGSCATIEHHGCGGENACKGQGGCGKIGVENDCKGKGLCHVPLMAGVWGKARTIFEAKMQKAGKEFGNAPAK